MTHPFITTTARRADKPGRQGRPGKAGAYVEVDGPAMVAIGSVWHSRRNGRTIEVVSAASAHGGEPHFAARSYDSGQTRRISWTTLHRDYQPGGPASVSDS